MNEIKWPVVVVGNYEDFRWWCRENRVLPKDHQNFFRHVYYSIDILGRTGPVIWNVRAPRKGESYAEIEQYIGETPDLWVADVEEEKEILLKYRELTSGR